MKKIGIITIVRVNNYGAELQAYALQRKLANMGYDSELIDYLYYIHPNYIKEKKAVPQYAKYYPLVKRIKGILFPMMETAKSYMNKAVYEKRNARFVAFHKANTRFSRCYDKFSALYENPPKYDVYCVGSDQVWNPFSYTSLDPYFLTFAPKDAVKFAYASSFGVSEIPAMAIESFKQGLQNINAISVREKTAVSIVKAMTGQDAVAVADPTLLLNAYEWSEILDNSMVPQEKYMLLYVLKESAYITETALRIAKEKRLKVVRICRGAYRQDPKNSSILNIMDAGPAEYLALFKNATMVMTNSFHGTVFSIQFNRDFYTIVSRNTSNNSRQIDLLSTLGIDRIKYTDTEFSEKSAIEWDVVNKRVEEYRLESINYLQKAINNGK
ncbi:MULTISPECIES: polysaccharide pyruvyl transferase family protein [unclassified Bacteroides]|uniref:polysaccharide pyruvyl transferase family protein n=1 Tax=unclassified Bacteroides TaxID=2646097 RepID=UPI00168BC46B|nr:MULTISPECIES: polysaccharide pyruvyl transferase family protein [unclassified Bacteroides]MBD3589244.1 polysaccharide pyruvyl transferase family protein [Bacteroides sp. GM023]